MLVCDCGYNKIPGVYSCGCFTSFEIGDASMGNLEVWHGSVDILFKTAVVNINSVAEECDEEDKTAYETKT